MRLPNRMNYIEVVEPGGPEVLRLASGAVPQPGSGEVLIRVLAAGVNRPDVLQRKGLYPPPRDASPILGLEVAGEVVAVGAEVSDLTVGTRVTALTNGGGYAEYCTVPAAQCLPWPKGYDAVMAAALPETYFTVWANLFELGHLAPGQSVLVHGGSGGIGVTVIQLAKEFGSYVYATAGTKEKCDFCLRLGADGAINYHESDFSSRIMELTESRGVDVVMDIVGGPYTMRNIACLRMDGRIIQIAFMQGSKVEDFDLLPVMMRRLTVTGSTMRPRRTDEKGRIARSLREKVWPVLDAGRCGPVIYRVFSLEEAAEAHRLMESGVHMGKIVFKVAG